MKRLLLAGVGAMLLLLGGTASAADGWKRVTIERQKGAIHASLSFTARRRDYARTDYARVALVVRRAGTVVVDDRRNPMPTGGRIHGLALQNVWGDGEPEALVRVWTGGNRCCTQLRVALTDSDKRGRVVLEQFPFNVRVDRHRGRFDFISSDFRFMCAFASCAGSSKPVQVFTIDRRGRRFVDVTRSRRDLVAASAARHWKFYVDAPDVGMLAPWCAEQHLLGRKRHCDGVLAQELARGNVDRRFIRTLRSALVRWGYR